MAELLYGVADFSKLRKGNGYFVDKTDLIARLEQFKFCLFLRPRRFGKSLLASILCHYYDIYAADKYEELFKGTKIYANPTAERNKYLILYFNFGSVSSDCNLVQDSFASRVDARLGVFAEQYAGIIPENVYEIAMGNIHPIEKMSAMISKLSNFKHPVYVIIDEYDRFANTLLAESGLAAYNELCHGDGFFKQFFSVLKTESESYGSIIERCFITGVSPLVMDDVTSGFNIGTNISSLPLFSQLTGFTHGEISEMLDYYSKFVSFDKDLAFKTIIGWYDNYRFCDGQEEPVANTTQVIEHLMQLYFNKRPPSRPVDSNMKQDYAKVKHLLTLNNKLNGSFAKFEGILEKGGTIIRVKDSFQAKELANPENFASLLFYFGLLSKDAGQNGPSRLVIHNSTMRQMLSEIASMAYQDILGVNPCLESLACALDDFSQTGDFKACLDIMAAFTDSVFTLRDCIEGEKTVQAILATLLFSVKGPYRCYNEIQLNSGFCDLALFPAQELGTYAGHAALLELKYVRKAQKATKAILAKLRSEAVGQLENYAQKTNEIGQEWKRQSGRDLAFHRYCLIFQGGKLLDFSEI